MKLAMFKRTIISCILAGLSAVVAPAASAAVLTFEGVVADGAAIVPITPYTEGNFTFTANLLSQNAADGIAGKNYGVNNNGSATLIFCASNSGCSLGYELILMATAPFSIFSIDAGAYVPGYGAGTLDLIGSLVGGGTVSQTVNADDSFETFALNGFSNLSSLTLIGRTTRGISIDNLVVQEAVAAVPEPGTLALGSLALMGLLASRRKRIQK